MSETLNNLGSDAAGDIPPNQADKEKAERAALYASMLIAEMPSGHQSLVTKIGLE